MVEFSDLLFGDLNEFGEDFSKKTKVRVILQWHATCLGETKGRCGDMSRRSLSLSRARNRESQSMLIIEMNENNNGSEMASALLSPTH